MHIEHLHSLTHALTQSLILTERFYIISAGSCVRIAATSLASLMYYSYQRLKTTGMFVFISAQSLLTNEMIENY